MLYIHIYVSLCAKELYNYLNNTYTYLKFKKEKKIKEKQVHRTLMIINETKKVKCT